MKNFELNEKYYIIFLGDTMNYKITVAVSNRHVHLTKEDADILFGSDYNFKIKKPLSQTGQYAYEEVVTLKTDKNKIENVRILGPVRKYTQVELSKTDSALLGLNPPLRDSGDLKNSEKITIIGPKGEIEANESVIIAHRHIHMNEKDVKFFGVKNNDLVSVKVSGIRGGIFNNVRIKEDTSYVLEMHIDRDEANAFDIKNNDLVEIIK